LSTLLIKVKQQTRPKPEIYRVSREYLHTSRHCKNVQSHGADLILFLKDQNKSARVAVRCRMW